MNTRTQQGNKAQGQNAPKPAAVAKVKESPRDKFVKLANRRGNRVIDGLASLSNLSNARSYEYTPEDVDAIFAAIDDARNRARNAFDQPTKKSKEAVTLVK